MEIEAVGRFDACRPLYTGVGKVNAVYSLTKRLAGWKSETGRLPSLVLNLGSAGSAQFRAGMIVNCTRFVQRDMDATALGFEPFSTPFDSESVILSTKVRFESYPEATCGTGDHFATDGKMTAWNVVDMEAYALAKVCAAEQVPFSCLKYITDGADGFAASSWEGALHEGAAKLHAALEELALV